jgi:hypothetical protein
MKTKQTNNIKAHHYLAALPLCPFCDVYQGMFANSQGVKIAPLCLISCHQHDANDCVEIKCKVTHGSVVFPPHRCEKCNKLKSTHNSKI